jgi:hypothetical protein
MTPDDTGGITAVAWIIILVASLSGLAFVIFFILPNCASLPVRGIPDGECGIEKMAVIYLCSAMFCGATAFSGYRLARAAAKGQKE